MNQNGPVIIIEDNADDKFMLEKVFTTLNYNNQIVFFADGESALAYLNQTDVMPFLILSDVKVPKISGFELRATVRTNEKLHFKCIPYLFFTAMSDKKTVIDAYAMSVQGFFVKPDNYQKLENTIRKIMEYWIECIAPNEYDAYIGQ